MIHFVCDCGGGGNGYDRHSQTMKKTGGRKNRRKLIENKNGSDLLLLFIHLLDMKINI